MTSHVIDPDALEELDASVGSISERAGLESLGLRGYRATPGEQHPLAHHYHDEQEEAF